MANLEKQHPRRREGEEHHTNADQLLAACTFRTHLIRRRWHPAKSSDKGTVQSKR
jgi:hypothetical protein